MTAIANGKIWLQRMKEAVPVAWRHDQMFRWAVIVGSAAALMFVSETGSYLARHYAVTDQVKATLLHQNSKSSNNDIRS